MPKLSPDSLAWIVALLFSGVAAWMFLLDGLAYYPVLPRLAPARAIEFHQRSLPLRRAALQGAIGGAALAGLVLCVFFSEGASRRLLLAHLLCLATLIVGTNLLLVPLNRAIAGWPAASPPPGWEGVWTRMIAVERLRSVVPAVAFALELLAFAVSRGRAGPLG